LSTPITGAKNPHDGDLTFVGRVLAELPVDIRIGKLLVLGHVFGLLEECLIIGKSIEVNMFVSMASLAEILQGSHDFQIRGKSDFSFRELTWRSGRQQREVVRLLRDVNND
jgi:HrpA-like RNA helicase